ncbi:MAG: hypothetical protein R3E83_20005 [Burkholderiaceae bacterium]
MIGLVQPMASDWQSTPADVAMMVTVFALTFALAAPLVQMTQGPVNTHPIPVAVSQNMGQRGASDDVGARP